MKNNFKILFIVLIAFLFIFIGLLLSIKFNQQLPTTNYQPSIFPSPSPVRQKAKVSFVFDGDTIELSDKRRVRYIGINSPELNVNEKKSQCFAADSAKINRELVLGQEIEMEKDVSETDKYGRLLRYVYLDGIFLNEFLVRQGYAKLETVPPDTRHAQEFIEAEKEAKKEKRGLWGKCPL